jgi:YtkA-like
MSRTYAALLAVSLLCPLTACDSGEDDQTRAVESFTDGMALNSDQGAFRVMLWSDSGELEVGRNDLVMRIGFHDPSDPDAPGIGIPSARVDLDAWMPSADETMPAEPQVTYLGDGQYRLENVVLPDDGVWNFDFEVAVGDNMHETISLGFIVE